MDRQAATDCGGWRAAYRLWQIKQTRRAAQAATLEIFQIGPLPPCLTWIKTIVRLPPNDGACICDPNRVFNIEVACLPERNLVFVVDDDAMMLKSVARLLRQLGYESVLFPSAEAFANHSDFDGVICVLLDINLGDVSGIEVRRRLKEANISVPVIYITGNDSPAIREAAHQSGCLAYLTKPFSAKSLMEPLHRAATGWRSAPAYPTPGTAR